MRALVALGLLIAAPALADDCFDYGSGPVHWVSSSNLVTASGIAVSDEHVFVADRDLGLVVFERSSSVPVEVHTQTFPGSVYGVFLEDDTLYVVERGLGLHILDVADATAPTTLGTVALTGGWDVEVVDGTAYVSAEANGLYIVDVSEPSAPALLGTMDTPGVTRAAAVAHPYVYLADGGYGLHVIDVTDPTAPFIVTRLPMQAGIDIAVDDGLVYIIDSTMNAGSLDLVDVSSPAAPFLRCQALVGDDLHGLCKVGDIVYVQGFANRGYVGTVDVSDPDAPFLIQSFRVKDDWSFSRIAVDGTRAFVADQQQLVVGDLVPGAAATALATYSPPGGTAVASVVRGNTLFVATPASGIDVVDVSGPPTFLANIPGSYLSIDTDGALLCAVTPTGLDLVDVSNPGAPSPITTVPLLAPSHVTFEPPYAYVADIQGNWTELLTVVDCTNPNTPVAQTVEIPTGPAEQILIEGTVGYALCPRELITFDLTEPMMPVQLDRLWVPNDLHDLTGQAPFLYAASDSGVAVLDVTDPAALSVVTVRDFPRLGAPEGQMCTAVVQSGTTLYAADEKFVRVFDVSAPTELVAIGAHPLDATALTLDDAGRIVASGSLATILPPQCAQAAVDAPRAPERPGPAGAFPNPFSAGVTFALPSAAVGPVDLRLYDVRGSLRWSGMASSRDGRGVRWSGRDSAGLEVPAGVYFLRMTWKSGSATQKVTRIR